LVQLQKLNEEEILRYLGYQGNKSNEQTYANIRECEDLLNQVVQPRYLYQCFPITMQNDGIAVDTTGLLLKGESIQAHLKDCAKAIILCATLSASLDKAIRQMQITDMAKALLLDCCATVAIEQICDQLESQLQLKYQNFYFTKRFSPGYGDLPISNQKNLLTLLDAPKKIGLFATSNSILTPKKSVTAIIGLSNHPIEKERLNCLACNMNKICSFRKRGERCGL
jgi:hypothetical protein